jgi:2-hydroxychromene-2-carboxylate isomerase
VELVWRPIYVPRERGLMIAELLGGKENRNTGSYNREDCRRWSERFAIPMSYPDPNVFRERAKNWATSPFDREELPARAFYAADASKRDLLDQALFEAAWVEGLDVNEPATIEWAAKRAGLDPAGLMTELAEPGPAEEARSALAEFERLQCPSVPTVVVSGRRFFGKDRVDWVADICRPGGLGSASSLQPDIVGDASNFQVYVLESGHGIPSLCNGESAWPGGTFATNNPFTPDVLVFNKNIQAFSWGYRNGYAIRFPPDYHPFAGGIVVGEDGPDQRGARPSNNAPDAIHLGRQKPDGSPDYHGWPDRFGFLPSSQAVYNPIGGTSDDHCVPDSTNPPSGCTPGEPSEHSEI